MTIFHVDMNSFFASCEQSRDPGLRGKPLIVCGDPKNRAGIVLAASYEAKALGVKTTMFLGDAKRLCPDGVFVPSDFHLYSAMSRRVMAIFDDFTPLKEQASIDEAYLDMTGTRLVFGDSLNAARLIQDRVYGELHLGCSIGISTNKLLAKMASDMRKPMGITELYESDVPAKLWPMPAQNLFGVGKKTADRLRMLGIFTIGDLAHADQECLRRTFGDAAASYLHEAANGRGSEKLEPDARAANPSISSERTYGCDLSDPAEIKNELLFLSDAVGFRLRREKETARCVTLKIKYGDFRVVTRSRTVETPIDSTDAICRIASELLDANWNRRPVRLLGIGVSGFGQDGQLSLFASGGDASASPVEQSVDRLRERYGYDSVGRCSLMGKRNKKLE